MVGAKRKEDLQQAVDAWNAEHPNKGTPVRVLRDLGGHVETITTSGAYVLGGHSAVIHVEGISGCFALERVKAIGQAPPASKAEEVTLPPGPWTPTDWGSDPKTGDPYCIRLIAADGSRVVDVSFHPSVGGRGLAWGRAIAAWIANHAPKEGAPTND
jgi:hypothetical protein